jgi:putative CocE/NonD family hydrolase
VRIIDNTWIPLADGSRLAARLWLPDCAEQSPVPAVLEYLPYRKDDGMAQRDQQQYAYQAGFGYACVRVDLRGTGGSDGILLDEYLAQEQEDALEVIAWIAAQPWCSGAVGMLGISWSGFNSLQVAACRPPALKAIITVCSTDDRYADDVHYMGGCVLAYDMLPWAATMLAFNALPPDPLYVGERWRDMWLARIEQTPPYVEAWLTHQRRDAYWKHGSVCEDYAAITCPVYAVGGWADGYTNSIPRLLAGLSVPRKGLIGPWSHSFPWAGRPGPAIGFLQEAVRWWDHWLKGEDTGLMAEPMLRVWLQDSVPPATYYADRPGRWVAESAWPSPRIQPIHLWLRGDGGLGAEAAPAALSRPSNLRHGLDSGVWCSYGYPGEAPADQRGDDSRALTFTTAPLTEPVEILGFPEVTIELSVDRPAALLAARLCDVAPDGASSLVSYGLLNLTHHSGHEAPRRLTPAERFTVTVQLNAIAHHLPAGHCWRLALATDYWPLAWPSPEPATLTVYTGPNTRLTLPVRPAYFADDGLPPFGPPEHAAPLAVEELEPGVRARTFIEDAGRLRLTSVSDDGRQRLTASGIEMESRLTDTYDIVPGEPLSASVASQWELALARGGWRVRVVTDSHMQADAQAFTVTNTLHAYEGEALVATKTWNKRIPRDGS